MYWIKFEVSLPQNIDTLENNKYQFFSDYVKNSIIRGNGVSTYVLILLRRVGEIICD